LTILWDWNGTLLDDVDLTVQCEQEALRQFGYPAFTKEEYLLHFDFPVMDFYRKHGVRESDCETVAAYWYDLYVRGFRGAHLRPDALEVLNRFQSAGVPQAIISAARHDTLLEQTACFPALAGHFLCIQGIAAASGSSKIHTAVDLLHRLQWNPGTTWLIGDSLHDLETASALQCRCILVSGGHQHENRLIGNGVPVTDNLSQAADLLLTEVSHE